jgi:hypothetical protein
MRKSYIYITNILEEFFLAHGEDLADRDFDDQFTGVNPRYPLIADLKHLMLRHITAKKLLKKS